MSGTPDVDDRLEIDPEDDERTDDSAGEPDEADDDSPDDDAGDGADATATDDAEPRGRRQFGELRESNRELARQNAEYTRRLAELEARINSGQQYQPPQETPQQRANRLSLLSPEERIGEELLERDRYWQNENQRTRALVLDSSDKATFAASTATDKYARRFAAEVEKQHAQILREKGIHVEREVILNNLLGQRMRQQAGKPNSRVAETRRRQAAAPAKSGSDVRPSRRAAAGSASDFEDRFGDIPI